MDEERKRALKQQVRDQERRAFLNMMPINLKQATNLIAALSARLEQEACDHTHKMTTEWCKQRGLDADSTITWAREQGGYCDCEVAGNLAEPIANAGKLQE